MSKLWSGLAIAVTVVLATVWTIAAGARQFVVSHWPDDAMFYNIVARNIVRGLGSTCDGIAPTNGYQPLWMWVHVVLAWMFNDTIVPEVILQSLLLLVALFLLYDSVAALTTPAIALGLCLIATCEQTFFRVLSSGMETHLAFIALLLILRLTRQRPWQAMGPRQRMGLSAALALLFFSRLDGGLMWPGLGLLVLTGWLGGAEPIGRRAAFLARVLAAPLALAVAYLLFNDSHYGMAIPVSGAIKSLRWSQILEAGHWSIAPGLLGILFQIDSLALIRAAVLGGAASEPVDLYIPRFVLIPLVLLGMRLCLRRHPRDASLRILCLYVALHATYYTTLQADAYHLRWARGPELLLMSIALASLLHDLLRRLSARFRVSVLAAPVLLLLALGSVACNGLKALKLDVVRDFEVGSADFWAAVVYIRDRLPQGSVIASNNIGFIGYFADRPVFSVDGLLNSVEYDRDYLGRGRKTEYMKIHGVHYSINALPKRLDPIGRLCEYYPGLRREDVSVVALFTRNTGASWLRDYTLYELQF